GPGAIDEGLGKALDGAKIPVVIGSMVEPDGKYESFAPKVNKPPALGAVNLLDDKVIRVYRPYVYGAPSLAVRAARAAGAPVPAWADSTFRLHFYGPNKWKDKQGKDHDTYHYV